MAAAVAGDCFQRPRPRAVLVFQFFEFALAGLAVDIENPKAGRLPGCDADIERMVSPPTPDGLGIGRRVFKTVAARWWLAAVFWFQIMHFRRLRPPAGENP